MGNAGSEGRLGLAGGRLVSAVRGTRASRAVIDYVLTVWEVGPGALRRVSSERVALMREMFVAGLQVDEESSEHLLVLQEREGTRGLALWIGAPEAVAIAVEQQGQRPERPLTHNLLSDTVQAFGRQLEQVIINDLREGTFYAELVFDGDVRVSARPSDSVALALHMGVTIHVADAVLEDRKSVV